MCRALCDSTYTLVFSVFHFWKYIPGTIYFALLKGTYHFTRYDNCAAFNTPFGLFNLLEMPFGTKNSIVPECAWKSFFGFVTYQSCFPRMEFHHILPYRDIDPYQFRYKLPVVSISVLNYNNCKSAKTFCNHLYALRPRRVNG